jgi:hypothetical protein
VKTHKIVGQMRDEYGKPMHSEKYLELAFSNGKLVQAESQFGEGVPSAVVVRKNKIRRYAASFMSPYS